MLKLFILSIYWHALNYLTLKAESHTLNYTNLWKELKALLIISVISIINYTKPFCIRIFPSTLPIAGSGQIKSAGTEESAWEIAKRKKKSKQEENESNLKSILFFFLKLFWICSLISGWKRASADVWRVLLENMLPHSEIHSSLSGNFLDFSWNAFIYQEILHGF